MTWRYSDTIFVGTSFFQNDFFNYKKEKNYWDISINKLKPYECNNNNLKKKTTKKQFLMPSKPPQNTIKSRNTPQYTQPNYHASHSHTGNLFYPVKVFDSYTFVKSDFVIIPRNKKR